MATFFALPVEGCDPALHSNDVAFTVQCARGIEPVTYALAPTPRGGPPTAAAKQAFGIDDGHTMDPTTRAAVASQFCGLVERMLGRTPLPANFYTAVEAALAPLQVPCITVNGAKIATVRPNAVHLRHHWCSLTGTFIYMQGAQPGGSALISPRGVAMVRMAQFDHPVPKMNEVVYAHICVAGSRDDSLIRQLVANIVATPAGHAWPHDAGSHTTLHGSLQSWVPVWPELYVSVLSPPAHVLSSESRKIGPVVVEVDTTQLMMTHNLFGNGAPAPQMAQVYTS